MRAVGSLALLGCSLLLGSPRPLTAQGGGVRDTVLTTDGATLRIRVRRGGRSAAVFLAAADRPAEWDRLASLAAARLAITVVTIRSLDGAPDEEVRVRAVRGAIARLGLLGPLVVVAEAAAATEAERFAVRWPAMVAGLVLLDPVTAEVRSALGQPKGPALELGRRVPVRVVSAGRRWGRDGDRVIAAQQRLARASSDGRAWVAQTVTGSVAEQAPELALAALSDLVRGRRR
jgi:hypothetical protein